MRRLKTWALTMALLVLPLGIVLADEFEEQYLPIPTAPAEYRRGLLSSNDPDTWAVPIDVSGADASVQATKGNPNLTVSARFTTGGDATVTVVCNLFQRTMVAGVASYNFMGVAGVSTATSVFRGFDLEGLFPSRSSLWFDTRGATHWELRVHDISAGSVELVPWSYGSETRGPSRP